LSGKRIVDRDLREVITTLSRIDRSLSFLDTILTEYAEFTPDLTGQPDDSYAEYLTQLSALRPIERKADINRADASNLAQTSELRRLGYGALLVTDTRAVKDVASDITREPLAFALEAIIRHRFWDQSRGAVKARLGAIITALNDVIGALEDYVTLLRADRESRPRVKDQLRILADALSLTRHNPAIRDMLELLAAAASAQRSSRDHFRQPPQPAFDLGHFASLQANISDLRRQVGDLPAIEWRQNYVSTDHLTYSILDSDETLLLAAENCGDELAIAWDTGLSWGDFCDLMQLYAARVHVREITVAIRLGGRAGPYSFQVSNLEALRETVITRTRRTKFSLMKLVCDDDIFWHDGSTLHYCADPRQVDSRLNSKIAVSLHGREHIEALVEVFLASSMHKIPAPEARRSFERLLKLEPRNG